VARSAKGSINRSDQRRLVIATTAGSLLIRIERVSIGMRDPGGIAAASTAATFL